MLLFFQAVCRIAGATSCLIVCPSTGIGGTSFLNRAFVKRDTVLYCNIFQPAQVARNKKGPCNVTGGMNKLVWAHLYQTPAPDRVVAHVHAKAFKMQRLAGCQYRIASPSFAHFRGASFRFPSSASDGGTSTSGADEAGIAPLLRIRKTNKVDFTGIKCLSMHATALSSGMHDGMSAPRFDWTSCATRCIHTTLESSCSRGSCKVSSSSDKAKAASSWCSKCAHLQSCLPTSFSCQCRQDSRGPEGDQQR